MAIGSYYDPESDPQRETQRRKAAYALLLQGTSGEPVRAWSQGAARVAQAMLGGYDLGTEDRQKRQEEAQIQGIPDMIFRRGGSQSYSEASPNEPPSGSVASALTDYQPGADFNLPTPTYAQVRAPYAVRTPQEKAQLFANANAEVGGQGDVADRAYLESVVNRARARDVPTIAAATDRNYYPPVSIAGKPPGPERTAQLDAALTDVMSGSNYARGATGNASGTVGFAGGPQTLALGPGKERFGIEGPDRNTAFLPQQPGQGQQYALLGNTATDAMAYAPETAASATDLPPEITQGGTPAGAQRYAQAGPPTSLPRPPAGAVQRPEYPPGFEEQFRSLWKQGRAGRDMASQLLQQYQKPREQYRPPTPEEERRGIIGVDMATGKPQPGSMNVNVSTEKKGQEHLAIKAIDAYTEAQQASRESQKRIAMYDRLEEAAKGFRPGATAEMRLTAQRYLKDLGITAGENVPEGEVMKMISSQLAIHAQPKGQGAVSNYEREMYAKSIPNMTQSPEGLRTAVGINRSLEKFDMEVARIYRDSARKNGGTPVYLEVQDKIAELGSPLTESQSAAISRNQPSQEPQPAPSAAPSKGGGSIKIDAQGNIIQR